MKNKICILAIIAAIILSATYKTKPVEYLGQQCPPDMVFIKGNDSIASFFMSKSQETNINYVIYLEWLKEAYQEYPEIAINAEPTYSPLNDLHKFNDPPL